MKRLASSFATLLFATSVGFSADEAPTYNLKTEAQVTGNITAVNEISTGALPGVYVTVKGKDGSLEIYLAPADFVKLFDVKLKVGSEVAATVSKVKLGDKDIALARLFEIGKVDLILRDPKGIPQWLWMIRPVIPTGL